MICVIVHIKYKFLRKDSKIASSKPPSSSHVMMEMLTYVSDPLIYEAVIDRSHLVAIATNAQHYVQKI